MFQIGWVDYSREERNKIMDIIRLLGDQEALDELGIGVVRDAFSNLLFPGISTLQTRAKYFVLVPYLFQMAQNQGLTDAAQVGEFIRKMEDKLVSVLVKNSAGADGIIGSLNYKNGKTVKMKPSNIYWNGLQASGILRFRGVSFDRVCRQVCAKSLQFKSISLKTSDKDEAQDDADALRSGDTIFTPIVPSYNVMKDTTIELTADEALYLKRQFCTAEGTKGSLLAFMLKENRVFPSFFDVPAGCLDEPLSTYVKLAQRFATFIYGAHLLYNIILAQGCSIEDDKIRSIKAEFDQWTAQYQSPPLDQIIAVTGCPMLTQKFFRDFDRAIQQGDLEEAKQLLIARERMVKPNRQKLNRPDYYTYQSPLHWYRLNFRYNTAKKIAEDILKPLQEGSV